MSLRVEQLSFSYGNKSVLKDISVPGLESGKLTVLLGPNASGKSTFFRCTAGLLASGGLFFVDDLALHHTRRKQRFETVCYMPQVFSSQAALTVF